MVTRHLVLIASLSLVIAAGCAADPAPDPTDTAESTTTTDQVDTVSDLLPGPGDGSLYYCSGTKSWCEQGWRCPFGTIYQHCYISSGDSYDWQCYCTN